jgi:hypothetical protein
MNEPDRMQTLLIQGKMDIPVEVAANIETYYMATRLGTEPSALN